MPGGDAHLDARARGDPGSEEDRPIDRGRFDRSGETREQRFGGVSVKATVTEEGTNWGWSWVQNATFETKSASLSVQTGEGWYTHVELNGARLFEHDKWIGSKQQLTAVCKLLDEIEEVLPKGA